MCIAWKMKPIVYLLLILYTCMCILHCYYIISTPYQKGSSKNLVIEGAYEKGLSYNAFCEMKYVVLHIQ